MRKLLALPALWLALQFSAWGVWIAEVHPGERVPLEADESGVAALEFTLPARAMLYMEPSRESFRPDREQVWKERLAAEVKLAADAASPVELYWFVKDKDGYYFQSRDTVTLRPGEERTLSIPLESAAGAWQPVGHEWQWCDLVQATVFDVGWQAVADGEGTVRLEFRDLRFEGERKKAPLEVIDWRMPGEGGRHRMLEAVFELSREYFNPFDPDEIACDFEVTDPEGEVRTYPAFYYQEFKRSQQFAREIVRPAGRPAWRFRYTPERIGEYRFRLIIDDGGEVIATEPRKYVVTATDEKGFVRVDERTGRYFRFSDGTPFFPVGINIHTNIDLRGEQAFGFAPFGDGGTYDYDEYFTACAANGITAAEVWMAAWSFALEWDAARSGYYGMGRYHLANAWRLDHLVEKAAETGIYLHLALDNHGKVSSHTDPEWQESPMNRNAPFAAANGAFLDNAGEFFRQYEAGQPAADYYRKRNRYIAARWGAATSILAFEFWSEGDLSDEFDANYNQGHSFNWHDWASRELKGMDSGRHLLTTHVCSDYGNNLRRRNLWDPENIDYVAGDAYYDTNSQTIFINHLKQYAEAMKAFSKPVMITEFGGSPGGGAVGRVVGDLHAALWGGFMLGQAGAPFIWWHDFVHRRGGYPHYYGFSRFIGGIDRGDPAWSYALLTPAEGVEAMTLSRPGEVLGWVYRLDALYSYPDDPASAPVNSQVALEGVTGGEGEWRVDFYHTLSGEKVAEATAAAGVPVVLPDFQIDLAFKAVKL